MTPFNNAFKHDPLSLVTPALCVYVCGGSGGGALNYMGGGPVLSQPGPFPSSQALRMTLAESAITHPSEQETHTSAFSSRPLMCLEVIVWRAQDGSGGGEGTGRKPRIHSHLFPFD